MSTQGILSVAAFLLATCTSATVNSARQASISVDEDVSLAWQLQVSSTVPIVDRCIAMDAAGGRVFTLASGSFPNPGALDSSYSLMAFDAASGANLWSTIGVGVIPQLTPQRMTASSDGTSVFVAGKYNKITTVAKYDATDGSLIWGVALPLPTDKEESVADLAVSADGSLVALGISRVEFMFPTSLTEVVTTCLDGQTGSPLWSVVRHDPAKLSQDAGFVAIDAAGGVVHAVSRAQTSSFAGRVVIASYDSVSGTELWSDEYASSLGSSRGSLVLDSSQSRMFIAVTGSAPEVLAYDSLTGALLWSSPTSMTGRHLAVRPDGARVAVAGSSFGLPAVDVFAAVSGNLEYTGIVDTGLPSSLVVSEGLSYSPDASRIVVALDGNFLAQGSSTTQALVAAAIDTSSGASDWITAEDFSPTTGGDVCDSALIETTAGTRIALTTELNTGSTQNLRMLSLEIAGGSKAWETTTSSSAERGVDSFHDVALSPDGAVAFASGLETEPGTPYSRLWVRSVDAGSGVELWSCMLSDLAASDSRVLISPAGDVVFVGALGTTEFGAAAIDTTSGAVLWERDWSGPTGRVLSRAMALSPDGSKLFLCGESTYQDPVTFVDQDRSVIYALDTVTGSESWSDDYFSDPDEDATAWGCAVGPNGINVYITGRTDDDLFVRAYEVVNGASTWTTSFDLATSLGGSPARDEGHVVLVDPNGTRVLVAGVSSALEFGGSSLESVALALDPATGAQMWSAPASISQLSGTSRFSELGTLSDDGSALFLLAMTQVSGTFENRIRARKLDAGTGALEWESISTSIDGGPVGGLALSPDGERLYGTAETSEFFPPATFVNGQRICMFDADTGEEFWSVDRSGDSNFASDAGGLAAGDGFVVVAGMTHLSATAEDGFLERYSGRPLMSAPASLSLAAGGQQELSLDAPISSAGEVYLVLGSFSGTTPGVMVQGYSVPLNLDAYFRFSAKSPNTGALVDTLGVLDPDGDGSAEILLPPALDPALSGLVFHHAFLSLDPSINVTTVSNSSSLTLEP